MSGWPSATILPSDIKDDPIRDASGESKRMRDADEGHSLHGGDGGKHLSDAIDELRVQGGSRFVKKEKFRFHDECARNGNALLLTNRDLEGITMCAFSDTDPVQFPPWRGLRPPYAAYQKPALAPGDTFRSTVLLEYKLKL